MSLDPVAAATTSNARGGFTTPRIEAERMLRDADRADALADRYDRDGVEGLHIPMTETELAAAITDVRAQAADLRAKATEWFNHEADAKQVRKAHADD